MFRICCKSFNIYDYDVQAKIKNQCFFSQLTLPSIINVIYEWYLLRIMVFLVMGRSAENIEEKKKADIRKSLKNEEKENRRIRESQIKKYTSLFLNYILLENLIWKKVVHIMKFSLQFSCVAGYLKQSNNTPKLNIHKYTNYNIIEIYINRAGVQRRSS